MAKRAGIIAIVVLAAIAVGAVVARFVPQSKNRGADDSTRASPVPTPMPGSGQVLTDLPSPTPILPSISHLPATPPPFAGSGPPANWLEGRYRVYFTMKADSCGQYVAPQEHDLVFTRLESSIRVEDTFTGSVLEGPAAQDGTFRVEAARPLVPGSRREFREVMTGKASPNAVSGDYFVYPAIQDCAVQLAFEGPKL